MKENLDQYQKAYTSQFPYHHDEELLLRAYVSKILDCLRDRHGLRLLSLGIGGQTVSATLRSEIAPVEYHIVEGSADIIEGYRQVIRPSTSIIIHHAYFEEIELPESSFDVIEMGFVLEHVDDPALVLRRFRQFLKPGGMLFTAVPNARSLHRQLGYGAGFMHDMYSLSDSDLALGHKRYFDADSFAQLVGESGYAIDAQFGLVLKPLTTGQLQSLALDQRVDQAFIDIGYSLPDICNGIMLVAHRA